MSNYCKMTVHPVTKQLELAEWLDDYFGPHRYAVRFPVKPDGNGGFLEPEIFREEDVNTLITTSKPIMPSKPGSSDKPENSEKAEKTNKREMKPKEYAGAGSAQESKKRLFRAAAEQVKIKNGISAPKPRVTLSVDLQSTLSLLARASGALEDIALSVDTKACPYKTMATKECIKAIANVILLYDAR